MFLYLHEPPRVLIWMSLAFKESDPLVRGHDLHLAPLLVVDGSVQGTVGANPKSRAIALLNSEDFKEWPFLMTTLSWGTSFGCDEARCLRLR